ncbi:MAG: NRDE family protein [Aquaticitalea sp.]
MCTVSFVNTTSGMVITSNRDENIDRKQALKPSIYILNEKKVCYPKDAEAGGTWFAMDEQDGVIVLLNGAKKKHIRLPNYRRSRGLVVLKLIASRSFLKTWQEMDLDDVEPFTLIMYQDDQLYETIWDGRSKSSSQLNIQFPHIWSSVTLYSKEIMKEKEHIFSSFLNNSNVNPDTLLDFHRYNEDLTINRKNGVKTQSITQWFHQKDKNEMTYVDLNDQSSSTTKLKRS